MRLVLLLIAVIAVALMLNSYMSSPEVTKSLEASQQQPNAREQQMQQTIQEAQQAMEQMNELMRAQEQRLQELEETTAQR